MSKIWSRLTPYYNTIFILALQIAIALGCFYSSYKFDTLVTARVVANEGFEERLRNFKCDPINKEIVLEIMKGSVQVEENLKHMLFWFGCLSVCTTIFAARSLIDMRKKHAIQIEG